MEEYFLRSEEKDVFMIWQSRPAVVVGKHQNALAEINYRFLREQGILLARRLSGGGTVFHGPGNVNFSFIRNGETGKLVDFKRFIQPVVQFLLTLGIKAEQGPRNEILVSGKKISGNAEHVFRNRVLHHGTLLFNADLDLLREAIRTVPGKYVDKAVQSNRSSVINLADSLHSSLNVESFTRLFLNFIRDQFNGQNFQPSHDIMMAIDEQSTLKYRSWAWIFGWSPDYEFRNRVRFPAGPVEVNMKIHRGYITDCKLESPGIHSSSLRPLQELLIGSPHEMENLMIRFRDCNITGCDNEKCLQELVYGFF